MLVKSFYKQTHLTQVEDDYKEKLEKETLAKIDREKVDLQIILLISNFVDSV
jgi:hypothetical protein